MADRTLRVTTQKIISDILGFNVSQLPSDIIKVKAFISNLFNVINSNMRYISTSFKDIVVNQDDAIKLKRSLSYYQTTTTPFPKNIPYERLIVSLRDPFIMTVLIKDVILTILQKQGLDVRNVQNINDYSNLNDVMDDQEGIIKKQDRTGPIDLFTNSELVQDNITELNKLIERINLELYNNLSSGYRFNEKRVNERYTTVEDLENDLKRLSSNDTKMISDKFDLIINDFKDGDSANHYETVRNYFKLGIYPLKKVNVSDQNKPIKNANLITGTQNIYKVENTQNPLKISSYVNNDLGDYIVNGKKINIKLVGLNYIVKEGAKTKIFKSLSYAKQFIYNGGFDMYNNNKSKFISNVSKDFNNKKQPLRLSYSSNIF